MEIFFPQEKATRSIQKRDSRRVSVSTLHFDRGLQHLSESDPVLRIVIQHLQPQPPEPREANFESLIRIISGQQLSSAAAYNIYRRLKQTFEDSVITPAMVLSSSKEQLLACGRSNAKARYITLIAQEFAEQPNLIGELRGMSSEEVLTTLQRFKGIGIWSASIFALFYLHHPDVFAWGDVSLKKAVRLLYEEEDLSEPQMEAITRPWRPYRSTACLVLWKWLDEGAIRFS